MDAVIQAIGLTIMCASLAGFFGTLIWIVRRQRQR